MPFGFNIRRRKPVKTYTSDTYRRAVTGEVSFRHDPHAEFRLLKVYPKNEKQAISGFGGAVTQAAAVTWSRLPEDKRRDLLDLCFSPENNAYNLCRIPIQSCDFSERSYVYLSDREDVDLGSFRLSDDDEKLMIPFCRAVLEVNPDLELIASPWSPPAFMKTNRLRNLGGHLKARYREMWAALMARSIHEMRLRGVPITRVTVQNEPNAAQPWESCLYSPAEEISFAVRYLRPALDARGLEGVRILVWDHNKDRIMERADGYAGWARHGEAGFGPRGPVSGFAFHWYTGDHFEALAEVSAGFPHAELIMSEMCTAYQTESANDVDIAESYAHELIGDVNAGANGFVDWNLILDARGGPNHLANFCNAPIMATVDGGSFEVGLESVYLWHVTHFVKRGARRIVVSRSCDKVDAAGFVNPDGGRVLVVLNRQDAPFALRFMEDGDLATFKMAAHSITTFTWGP